MTEGVRLEDGDYGRRAVINSAWSAEMTDYLLANDILDGDLMPLLGQKHLSRLSLQNHRHYSHKREEFGIGYSK